MCFSWLLPHSLTLRLALWNILAHLELKITGWELIFFFFVVAYNLSPLVSSFPSVRRCCHPSLGPRQGYNGSVWGLPTDTITWVADNVLLPGPTKAKQLLIQTGPFPLLQMTMKVDCELYKANTLLMHFSIPSRFFRSATCSWNAKISNSSLTRGSWWIIINNTFPALLSLLTYRKTFPRHPCSHMTW